MTQKRTSVEQQLPASVDAERSVLGAILLDNAAYGEATELLRPDDFSLDSHRRLFSAMCTLGEDNRAIDLITLGEELGKSKEIEAIGGLAYLSSLTDGLPMRPSIEQYVRIVRDKSTLRSTIFICNATVARAMDQSQSADEVLDSHESEIMALGESRVDRGLVSVKDVFRDAYGGLDRFFDADTRAGLPTGFTDLDVLLGGLKRKDLIIIAARPSMGKTSLAMAIAEDVSVRQGGVVGVFSMEMTREAILERQACAMAKVSSSDLRNGLNQEQRTRLTTALGYLLDAHLFIDDTRGQGVMEMRAKARRLKHAKNRLDLLVVDYLQLMGSRERHDSREQAVSEFSRGLKTLAGEVDCPVIAMSQLNRECEKREDKRPLLSDLRESGSIEQDADVVGFIYRDDYYDKESPERGTAEVIIRKNRNGPVDTVKLAWLGRYATFGNLSQQV